MSDVDILMSKFEAIKHRGKLDNAVICSATNDTCGDKLTFYVKKGKDGKIQDVRFSGLGCALSQVTADQLADYVIGKNMSDLKDLTFEDAVKGIGVKPIPGRVKCIVTSLNALKKLSEEEK